MFSTTLKWIQRIFLGVSVILIGLWCIKPVRDWMGSISWIDPAYIFFIIALALTLILVVLDKLEAKVGTICSTFNNSKSENQCEIIEHGVAEVYPHLHNVLSEISNKSERSLKVLGLTLYTAWPQISTWLATSDSEDWNIELCVLDPAFAKTTGAIQDKWISAINSQLEAINEFKRINSHRRYSIVVHLYSSLPAIHGFLVGSGALFISFSHWTNNYEQIDDPTYFYEYFRSNDASRRAKLCRVLFMSWFEHAKKIGGQS